MRRLSFVILTFCFISTINKLYGQDIHFSQFFSAPLYINSANSGDFNGDYRFVINNKNQWNSFTDAYSTFAGSVDASFNELINNKSKTGIGLQINNDIAGDGRFGTTQIYLSLANLFFFGENKKFGLGIGINAGYVMHGINFSNLYFGDQYDGERFNADMPSNELIENQKISYPDFGAGIKLKYKQSQRFNLEFGFATNHIFEPKRSFLEFSEAVLPIKFASMGFAEYNIKEGFWLEAYALHMYQQKHQELNTGAIMRFDYNPITFQSIYFGLLLRSRDAGIVVFGVKYQNIKFCFNYDINFSNLSTISRGKGGAEFSLIYIFLKPRPFQAPEYKKCPDFI